ncbi:MAG: hypothetical protein EXS25_04470 [Pedosphaera sp.]|nr:hypothetical protein [Pedosphaera sp.]
MSTATRTHRKVLTPWLARCCVVSLLQLGMAGEPLSLPSSARSETERRSQVYGSAREAYLRESKYSQRAWELARACFDRTEGLRSTPVKAALSTEGIEVCKKALQTDPTSASLHYYLGLNLGQLAQTRTLSALRLVRQMEQSWLTSRLLDAALDHAGADRSLGMLYAECPRAPLSVGSREKARHHLERCVDLAPHHPENRIYLVEQLLNWKDFTAAHRQFDALETLLTAARTRLSDDSWTAAWVDWTSRIQSLRSRLNRHP